MIVKKGEIPSGVAILTSAINPKNRLISPTFYSKFTFIHMRYPETELFSALTWHAFSCFIWTLIFQLPFPLSSFFFLLFAYSVFFSFCFSAIFSFFLMFFFLFSAFFSSACYFSLLIFFYFFPLFSRLCFVFSSSLPLYSPNKLLSVCRYILQVHPVSFFEL